MSDLSKISDEELMKIANIQNVSDDELMKIAGVDQPQQSKSVLPFWKKAADTFNTVTDYAKAPIDTLLSLATGAAAYPISKMAEGIGSITNPKEGQQVGEFAQNIYTYKPENPIAAGMADTVGGILSLPFWPAQKAKEVATKYAGPEVGSMVGTTAEAGTMALMPWGMGKIKSMKNKPISADKAATSIEHTVETGMNRGATPSSAGVKTLGQVKKYTKRATEAVQDIIEKKNTIQLIDKEGNPKPQGSLPETVHEFSQAIDQGKKQVFAEFDAMKKAAGEEGAFAETVSAAKELRSFGNNPVIVDNYPSLAQEALRRAEALEQRGAYSVDLAQEAIANGNAKLEGFYKNPSFEQATSAAIEQIVVNNLRKSLDTAITKEKGPGYQNLKNKYGAYKTIEKDVLRKSLADAKSHKYGLFDFANILTAAEAVSAIATFNPVSAGKVGMMQAAKSYMKWRNSPNTAVSQMFKNVDKTMKRTEKPVVPFTLESTGDLYPDQRALPPGPYSGIPTGEPYTPITPLVKQGGQGLVPTGIKRDFYPIQDSVRLPGVESPTRYRSDISLPEAAEMLSRHPMGNMSLVPTGIKRSYPEVGPLIGTAPRLSIVNRRYEGSVIRRPDMSLAEIERLRKQYSGGK
jgi:hypothetical protein